MDNMNNLNRFHGTDKYLPPQINPSNHFLSSQYATNPRYGTTSHPQIPNEGFNAPSYDYPPQIWLPQNNNAQARGYNMSNISSRTFNLPENMSRTFSVAEHQVHRTYNVTEHPPRNISPRSTYQENMARVIMTSQAQPSVIQETPTKFQVPYTTVSHVNNMYPYQVPSRSMRNQEYHQPGPVYPHSVVNSTPVMFSKDNLTRKTPHAVRYLPKERLPTLSTNYMKPLCEPQQTSCLIPSYQYYPEHQKPKIAASEYIYPKYSEINRQQQAYQEIAQNYAAARSANQYIPSNQKAQSFDIANTVYNRNTAAHNFVPNQSIKPPPVQNSFDNHIQGPPRMADYSNGLNTHKLYQEYQPKTNSVIMKTNTHPSVIVSRPDINLTYSNKLQQHCRDALYPKPANMYPNPTNNMRCMEIKQSQYEDNYANGIHKYPKQADIYVNRQYQYPYPNAIYSPNVISPTDSNVSDSSSTKHGMDDGGYGSRCSTSSSVGSVFNHDLEFKSPARHSRKYSMDKDKYPTDLENLINTSVVKKTQNDSKDKLDIRKFLSTWDETDEECIVQNQIQNQDQIERPMIQNAERMELQSEQLYLLEYTNISSEDVDKYKHITQITELPKNIQTFSGMQQNIVNNNNKRIVKNSSIENLVQHNNNNGCSKGNQSSTNNRNRPPSPVDIETILSQSVISKEANSCSFDIRPCADPNKEISKQFSVHISHTDIQPDGTDCKSTMDIGVQTHFENITTENITEKRKQFINMNKEIDSNVIINNKTKTQGTSMPVYVKIDNKNRDEIFTGNFSSEINNPNLHTDNTSGKVLTNHCLYGNIGYRNGNNMPQLNDCMYKNVPNMDYTSSNNNNNNPKNNNTNFPLDAGKPNIYNYDVYNRSSCIYNNETLLYKDNVIKTTSNVYDYGMKIDDNQNNIMHSSMQSDKIMHQGAQLANKDCVRENLKCGSAVTSISVNENKNDHIPKNIVYTDHTNIEQNKSRICNNEYIRQDIISAVENNSKTNNEFKIDQNCSISYSPTIVPGVIEEKSVSKTAICKKYNQTAEQNQLLTHSAAKFEPDNFSEKSISIEFGQKSEVVEKDVHKQKNENVQANIKTEYLSNTHNLNANYQAENPYKDMSIHRNHEKIVDKFDIKEKFTANTYNISEIIKVDNNVSVNKLINCPSTEPKQAVTENEKVLVYSGCELQTNTIKDNYLLSKENSGVFKNLQPTCNESSKEHFISEIINIAPNNCNDENIEDYNTAVAPSDECQGVIQNIDKKYENVEKHFQDNSEKLPSENKKVHDDSIQEENINQAIENSEKSNFEKLSKYSQNYVEVQTRENIITKFEKTEKVTPNLGIDDDKIPLEEFQNSDQNLERLDEHMDDIHDEGIFDKSLQNTEENFEKLLSRDSALVSEESTKINTDFENINIVIKCSEDLDKSKLQLYNILQESLVEKNNTCDQSESTKTMTEIENNETLPSSLEENHEDNEEENVDKFEKLPSHHLENIDKFEKLPSPDLENALVFENNGNVSTPEIESKENPANNVNILKEADKFENNEMLQSNLSGLEDCENNEVKNVENLKNMQSHSLENILFSETNECVSDLKREFKENTANNKSILQVMEKCNISEQLDETLKIIIENDAIAETPECDANNENEEKNIENTSACEENTNIKSASDGNHENHEVQNSMIKFAESSENHEIPKLHIPNSLQEPVMEKNNTSEKFDDNLQTVVENDIIAENSENDVKQNADSNKENEEEKLKNQMRNIEYSEEEHKIKEEYMKNEVDSIEKDKNSKDMDVNSEYLGVDSKNFEANSENFEVKPENLNENVKNLEQHPDNLEENSRSQEEDINGHVEDPESEVENFADPEIASDDNIVVCLLEESACAEECGLVQENIVSKNEDDFQSEYLPIFCDEDGMVFVSTGSDKESHEVIFLDLSTGDEKQDANVSEICLALEDDEEITFVLIDNESIENEIISSSTISETILSEINSTEQNILDSCTDFDNYPYLEEVIDDTLIENETENEILNLIHIDDSSRDIKSNDKLHEIMDNSNPSISDIDNFFSKIDSEEIIDRLKKHNFKSVKIVNRSTKEIIDYKIIDKDVDNCKIDKIYEGNGYNDVKKGSSKFYEFVMNKILRNRYIVERKRKMLDILDELILTEDDIGVDKIGSEQSNIYKIINNIDNDYSAKINKYCKVENKITADDNIDAVLDGTKINKQSIINKNVCDNNVDVDNTVQELYDTKTNKYYDVENKINSDNVEDVLDTKIKHSKAKNKSTWGYSVDNIVLDDTKINKYYKDDSNITNDDNVDDVVLQLNDDKISKHSKVTERMTNSNNIDDIVSESTKINRSYKLIDKTTNVDNNIELKMDDTKINKHTKFMSNIASENNIDDLVLVDTKINKYSKVLNNISSDNKSNDVEVVELDGIKINKHSRVISRTHSDDNVPQKLEDTKINKNSKATNKTPCDDNAALKLGDTKINKHSKATNKFTNDDNVVLKLDDTKINKHSKVINKAHSDAALKLDDIKINKHTRVINKITSDDNVALKLDDSKTNKDASDYSDNNEDAVEHSVMEQPTCGPNKKQLEYNIKTCAVLSPKIPSDSKDFVQEQFNENCMTAKNLSKNSIIGEEMKNNIKSVPCDVVLDQCLEKAEILSKNVLKRGDGKEAYDHCKYEIKTCKVFPKLKNKYHGSETLRRLSESAIVNIISNKNSTNFDSRMRKRYFSENDNFNLQKLKFQKIKNYSSINDDKEVIMENGNKSLEPIPKVIIRNLGKSKSKTRFEENPRRKKSKSQNHIEFEIKSKKDLDSNYCIETEKDVFQFNNSNFETSSNMIKNGYEINATAGDIDNNNLIFHRKPKSKKNFDNVLSEIDKQCNKKHRHSKNVKLSKTQLNNNSNLKTKSNLREADCEMRKSIAMVSKYSLSKKPDIPKLVIKRNGFGQHYTSETQDPKSPGVNSKTDLVNILHVGKDPNEIDQLGLKSDRYRLKRKSSNLSGLEISFKKGESKLDLVDIGKDPNEIVDQYTDFNLKSDRYRIKCKSSKLSYLDIANKSTRSKYQEDCSQLKDLSNKSGNNNISNNSISSIEKLKRSALSRVCSAKVKLTIRRDIESLSRIPGCSVQILQNDRLKILENTAMHSDSQFKHLRRNHEKSNEMLKDDQYREVDNGFRNFPKRARIRFRNLYSSDEIERRIERFSNDERIKNLSKKDDETSCSESGTSESSSSSSSCSTDSDMPTSDCSRISVTDQETRRKLSQDGRYKKKMSEYKNNFPKNFKNVQNSCDVAKEDTN